jgi:hypothetical protein
MPVLVFFNRKFIFLISFSSSMYPHLECWRGGSLWRIPSERIGLILWQPGSLSMMSHPCGDQNGVGQLSKKICLSVIYMSGLKLSVVHNEQHTLKWREHRSPKRPFHELVENHKHIFRKNTSAVHHLDCAFNGSSRYNLEGGLEEVLFAHIFKPNRFQSRLYSVCV